MKSFALWSAVFALGLTLTMGDAEAARRLGGGRSFGMQREAVAPQKSMTPAPAAPSQATAPQAAKSQPAAAAPQPQAQPKRSWMGPLAGLAAGLGLAALASHFGFGEGLASMLLIGLAVMAVIAIVGFIMRRRGMASQQPALAGAGGMPYQATGTGMDYGTRQEPTASFSPAAAPAAQAGSVPADFDVEGFVRHAKVNFLRLQAANDAGNIDDIRQFTTPEMFAEIKMDFVQRGQVAQETDVVTMDAQVLDVAEEESRYVASVRFTGQTREGREGAAEPFDEIWHLTKPRDGSHGWLLAGIQQVQ
ncbi:MAG: import inner rane translocase subunit Tim44 [Rhodocyclaceae bacterium]|nr:import inner rane translocase subunit Tim44 [Rhodocyclaceae bacterium]